jgi:purine-binding chemotaxis protein CheW
LISSARPSEITSAVHDLAGDAALGPDRLLVFDAGGRTFAVSAAEVREVVPFRQPTRLPGAPLHVSGIVNLRGTVVTVIDLAKRLGLSPSTSENRCIVLLNRAGRPVGLMVDNVQDVIVVNDDMIEQSRREVSQSFPELSRGIVRLQNGHVVLLDAGLLITQVLIS